MKFIVDAQLPGSLSGFLNLRGHDSIHTLNLPLKNKTSDMEIIQLADRDNRIVISKDIDFLNSHLIKTQPKKLIMVKTGNIPNKPLIEIFNKNLDLIIKMIQRGDLVEINQSFIAERKK